MKNTNFLKDAIIYEGTQNKSLKLNKYYDVKTIMKKSVRKDIQEQKRTSDLDKNDGWEYGDCIEFLEANKEKLFPKKDGIMYQVDFLLPVGWRSSVLTNDGSQIEYYDPHTNDSSENVALQTVYGISLKRLHTNVK